MIAQLKSCPALRIPVAIEAQKLVLFTKNVLNT